MVKAIDPANLDLTQLETLIDRYQQRGLTQDPLYDALVAEFNRRASPDLRLDTTISAIRVAAGDRRFISYGDVAEKNGVQWTKVRRKMPKHLDAVLWRCHHKGWPLITSIVVNQQHLLSGEMESSSLAGFVAGARRLGIPVVDEHAFMRDQQEKTFIWASLSGGES